MNILCDFLGFFPYKCTGFFGVIYPRLFQYSVPSTLNDDVDVDDDDIMCTMIGCFRTSETVSPKSEQNIKIFRFYYSTGR